MVDSDEMPMEQIHWRGGDEVTTMFDFMATKGTMRTMVGEDALEYF